MGECGDSTASDAIFSLFCLCSMFPWQPEHHHLRCAPVAPLTQAILFFSLSLSLHLSLSLFPSISLSLSLSPRPSFSSLSLFPSISPSLSLSHSHTHSLTH